MRKELGGECKKGWGCETACRAAERAHGRAVALCNACGLQRKKARKVKG